MGRILNLVLPYSIHNHIKIEKNSIRRLESLMIDFELSLLIRILAGW